MIRIAIVDDEQASTQLLNDYITQYETSTSDSFEITTFSDGLEIVSDYKAIYDIILLDIQMKHMNGMNTAEEIRKLDSDVIIIFITTTVHFATHGYLVDALGYALKPVTYVVFSQLMKKALKRLEKKNTSLYLTIDTEDGKMKIDINKIIFFESQNHTVCIHTDYGDFFTRGPLKRIEELLSSKGFFKCHNAYLVNLSKVNAIVSNNVTLMNNQELSISRSRKKEFLEALTDYIGGVIR